MLIVQLAASPFVGGPERQMLGLARSLPASSSRSQQLDQYKQQEHEPRAQQDEALNLLAHSGDSTNSGLPT